MRGRTRASTIAAILSVLIGTWVASGRAQQGAANIEVLQLRPNFYMIASPVSNIGVQIGPDGVVLANAGPAEAAGEVLAAIQKLTKEPIRYIINTSPDAELVGGNAAFAKAGLRMGALPLRPGQMPGEDDAAFIVAHEKVLQRMSAVSGGKPAFPTEAWPTETFNFNRKSMSFNGDGVEVLRLNPAHTDSDSVVLFRRSDVLVAGNVLDATRFPVIDLARGGSVQGEIDALNRLIDLSIAAGPLLGTPTAAIATGTARIPGGTEIIPGRGRVYRQIDVVDYRDAIVIVRDTIKYMIDQKMTLEQIKAAAPAKAWEPRFGATSGPWTTNDFVEAVYKSLTNEKPQSTAGR